MQDRNTPGVFIRDGVLSCIVLLLAFAALDDITTDKATSFWSEYTMLAAGALWLASVSVRLFRLLVRGFRAPTGIRH